jgi:hypothetical protein
VFDLLIPVRIPARVRSPAPHAMYARSHDRSTDEGFPGSCIHEFSRERLPGALKGPLCYQDGCWRAAVTTTV